MSDKLTEQKIDEMIAELLQERNLNIVYPDIGEIDTDDPGGRGLFVSTGSGHEDVINKDAIEKIADQDGNIENLTFDDLIALSIEELQDLLKLSNSPKRNKNTVKAIEKVILAKEKGMQSAQELSDIDDEKDIGIAQSKSIAYKSIATIEADPSQGEAMGSFPEGIATATKQFFSGDNSLFKRIQKTNSFLEALYKEDNSAKKIVGDSNARYLAGILFCDYLTTIVQQVDSGAAAYLFESLLAMMCGGRVVGKEGNAADFKTNKGKLGSAKFYAEPGAIGQKASGFAINEPVFYVIALKKGSGGGGTGDPRKIINLDIHTLVVMKYAQTEDTEKKLKNSTKKIPGISSFFVKSSGGKLLDIDVKNNEKIMLNKTRSILTKPITLSIGTDEDKFQDIKSIAIEDATAGSENIAQLLVKATNESQKANEKIQAYASSQKAETGDEAVKALISAETFVKELGKKAFDQQIGEAKFADLDKLILKTLQESLDK